MGAREETIALLQTGLTPVQIARQRGVTIQTIFGYLNQMVGRNKIRRSDILFSIPIEIRAAIVAALKENRSKNPGAVAGRLARRGVIVDEDDVVTVLLYGDARYALGDMYEDLCHIEIGLHRLIRAGLEGQFGPGESGWWRKGVRLNIRRKCQERREEDEAIDLPEPYCYTDLIDLREILKDNWADLADFLPKEMRTQKRELLADLVRLNEIRRVVMHPVRNTTPSEADFEFVRTLRRRLNF
jgi:Helix-turn-helix domain